MINYSTGEQNIITDDFQMIRLSEGYCPHKCPWCYEWKLSIPHQDYNLPKIIRTEVRISDMNILASNNPTEKIKQFESIKVDNKVVHVKLICGIDYRFLTQEIADQLKKSRFVDLHIAWDRNYTDQKKLIKAINMLINAGYNTRSLSVFMICNHPQISYEECLKKLNLCKYWNVKVNDCYFDNQFGRKKYPVGWNIGEIKDFRSKVRKHNQIVNFRIDPELKDG